MVKSLLFEGRKIKLKNELTKHKIKKQVKRTKNNKNISSTYTFKKTSKVCPSRVRQSIHYLAEPVDT